MEAKLIKLVEQHNVLYNKSCFMYNSRQKRAEAWNQISKALQVPTKACQIRWKTLRDRFVKIYNKSLQEPDFLAKNQWQHFSRLQFLVQQIGKKRISSFQADSMDECFEPTNSSDYSECTNQTNNENSSTAAINSATSPTMKIFTISKKPTKLPKETKEFISNIDPIEEILIEEDQQPDDADNAMDQQELNEFNSRLLSHFDKVDDFLESRHQQPAKKDNSSFYGLVGEKLSELSEEEQEDSKIYILNYLFEKVKESKKRKRC